MSETIEVDVVSVGTGVGGCAAAATAAKAGDTVLLLEKQAKIGGVTAYSGGQLWVPATKEQAAMGIDDTVEAGAAYLEELAGGWGDHDRTLHLLESAREALEYFEKEHGFGVQVIKGVPDYYYPQFPHAIEEGRYIEPVEIDTELLGEFAPLLRRSPVGSSGGGLGLDGQADATGGRYVYMGEALAAHFLHFALAAGAQLWVSSPATGLVIEDGRVVGVRVQRPEGEVVVRARKGVVLATGGYDWNPDFVHRFEGVQDPHGSAAPAGIEGDHITMATPAGAALSVLPVSRCVMQVGFPVGIDDEDGHVLHSSYRAVNPHEIVVNRSGHRFANESFYPAMTAAITAIDGTDASLPNWPCWLVFDADYLEGGAARKPSLDLAVKADSLRELAERAGIDPDGLEQSVAHYNAMCEQGRDSDFERGEQPWSMAMFRGDAKLDGSNPSIGPIGRAPFYAARMSRVGFGVASAGLTIDRDARVLTYAGTPIPGLYAAGNATARDDVGSALQSGVANTRGLAYGYLAGLHLSRGRD